MWIVAEFVCYLFTEMRCKMRQFWEVFLNTHSGGKIVHGHWKDIFQPEIVFCFVQILSRFGSTEGNNGQKIAWMSANFC